MLFKGYFSYFLPRMIWPQLRELKASELRASSGDFGHGVELVEEFASAMRSRARVIGGSMGEARTKFRVSEKVEER